MLVSTIGRTMKPIKKDELFGHLSGFLKARGIELNEGSYAEGIQKGCSILTETINLSQKGFEQAKTQIDKHLDNMRQVIHEHTAPKSAAEKRAAQAAKGSTKSRAKKASGQKKPRK